MGTDEAGTANATARGDRRTPATPFEAAGRGRGMAVFVTLNSPRWVRVTFTAHHAVSVTLVG